MDAAACDRWVPGPEVPPAPADLSLSVMDQPERVAAAGYVGSRDVCSRHPAAQVRTGLMIRQRSQRAAPSHLQVSETLASRSAILWRTADRSRCQPVLAGSAAASRSPAGWPTARSAAGPAGLRDRGVITEAEFRPGKAKILS
jgi:hypothetical protein